MKNEVKAAIEAILFIRSEKVTISEFTELLDLEQAELHIIINEMINEYNNSSRGIQIIKDKNSYIMCTKPEFSELLSNMTKPAIRRLSQAALETLAIIAYKQPVTKAEIEQIRGVKVEKIVNNLIEQGLIVETGKKQTVGKPAMYSTTDEFLKVFGLTSLDDLPDIKEGIS
ncbi:SMC-Scp complex subunit ScpB [Candidatus Syntrophocurvum alkaliphilum]|nr:SMC-Scp complex subunit ScpB [Candidatus Syntrophocurvum alkaliphilum]